MHYDRIREVRRLADVFRSQGFPQHIIDMVIQVNSNFLKRRPGEENSSTKTVWLVIPYLPCFRTLNLASRINDFMQRSWVRDAMINGPAGEIDELPKLRVRVSWKNGSRNILSMIRRQSFENCGG